jgi:hypothetical protein
MNFTFRAAAAVQPPAAMRLTASSGTSTCTYPCTNTAAGSKEKPYAATELRDAVTGVPAISSGI